MTRASHQSGFTLVELLIAMAVFAVMAAIAYGGLSSVISTRDSIDQALERSKQLQMATWRLQQDIEQTVARPIRDRFGDAQPALIGSPDRGLTLTRNGWANPLAEPRSTLQRVHYRLDGDHHFVRAYYRVVDQAQDSEPVESDLLSNVNNIEWRYLDRDNEWQDRWPPDSSRMAGEAGEQANHKPPVAVELRLDSAQWGRLRLLFALTGERS